MEMVWCLSGCSQQVTDRMCQNSKSAIVREKCGLYLALMLESWDINALRKHEPIILKFIKRGITDASGQARLQARRCFAAFAPIFPQGAENILKICDQRTAKALRALLGDEELPPPSTGKPKSKVKHKCSLSTQSAKSSKSPSPTNRGASAPTSPQAKTGAKASSYEHISPKFHGVEMDQDDLVATAEPARVG